MLKDTEDTDRVKDVANTIPSPLKTNGRGVQSTKSFEPAYPLSKWAVKVLTVI